MSDINDPNAPDETASTQPAVPADGGAKAAEGDVAAGPTPADDEDTEGHRVLR